MRKVEFDQVRKAREYAEGILPHYVDTVVASRLAFECSWLGLSGDVPDGVPRPTTILAHIMKHTFPPLQKIIFRTRYSIGGFVSCRYPSLHVGV